MGRSGESGRADDVLALTLSQFTIVLQKVAQAAKEHDIIAWWRSSVPGHVQCWQYTERESSLRSMDTS
jgi:hypothetical protein